MWQLSATVIETNILLRTRTSDSTSQLFQFRQQNQVLRSHSNKNNSTNLLASRTERYVGNAAAIWWTFFQGMVDYAGFRLLTKNYLQSGKDCGTCLDHNGVRWQEVQAHHNKLKTQHYETTNKADYTVPHPEKMEGDRTIPGPAMPSIDTFGRKLTDRVACDAHRRKGSYKWLDTYEPK